MVELVSVVCVWCWVMSDVLWCDRSKVRNRDHETVVRNRCDKLVVPWPHRSDDCHYSRLLLIRLTKLLDYKALDDIYTHNQLDIVWCSSLRLNMPTMTTELIKSTGLSIFWLDHCVRQSTENNTLLTLLKQLSGSLVILSLNVTVFHDRLCVCWYFIKSCAFLLFCFILLYFIAINTTERSAIGSILRRGPPRNCYPLNLQWEPKPLQPMY